MASRLGEQIRKVVTLFRGKPLEVPVITKSKRHMTENAIITSDEDAVSTGTVVIDENVTVTVEDGGYWLIDGRR